jgi:hypothetical protein
MVRKGLVRKGPTKRKRGDIWAQLSISACVLLLPPLVMAAGVMVIGPSSPQGQQGAVQEAAAPQAPAAANTSVANTAVANAAVSVAERPGMPAESTTSFALASAETHPVITEKRPIAGPRPPSEQPAAAAPRTSSGAAAVKDPARYSGAAPVTLVHAGTASGPSVMPEVEAPPPAADTPIAVPEESSAATRFQGARGRSRLGRHEPRPVYRTKYQRTKSLSDFFLRPTTRPRRG